MPYDAQHALEHPEVAGLALGALDSDDTAAFGEHLHSCGQCQAQVAEFDRVARSLALAVPAAEPPPDLEFKTLAAVQYAVTAESRTQPGPAAQPEAAARPEPAAPKPSPAGKASRWWHLHWTNPLLPVATALGAGILLDAVVIRSLLLPALIGILGRWNWWLPAPAARILRVSPSAPVPEPAPPGHQTATTRTGAL